MLFSAMYVVDDAVLHEKIKIYLKYWTKYGAKIFWQTSGILGKGLRNPLKN